LHLKQRISLELFSFDVCVRIIKVKVTLGFSNLSMTPKKPLAKWKTKEKLKIDKSTDHQQKKEKRKKKQTKIVPLSVH